MRQSDITQAAQWLAIFHRTHGIEITYRSLARVLGMSKSALYRTYRGLVGEALKSAKRKAMFPTQKDTRQKKDEEDAQATSGPLEDGHLLSRKVPHDLPFEYLYNAVLTLHAAGKPIDAQNITAVLRRHGVLAEGGKLSDYFDSNYVANAVRAVAGCSE
jgi:hypothetical protein